MDRKKRLMKMLSEGGEIRSLLNSLAIGASSDSVERFADYLLREGVIVPPANIGDRLWWVCDGCDPADSCGCSDEKMRTCAHIHEHPYGIRNIYWNGREFGTLIDGDYDPTEFGTQYAFHNYEDALKWTKEHSNGGDEDGEF